MSRKIFMGWALQRRTNCQGVFHTLTSLCPFATQHARIQTQTTVRKAPNGSTHLTPLLCRLDGLILQEFSGRLQDIING
ncbi:hypothetical protein MBAV_001234 [Candidatus Magnetobacterium bavaricum]|uniref:Uncharacterized protein n=1 Tax=Candidatus Magnetobacterium bavaricum TaxID=29290 RepID=A0A0F3H0V3_9BACT|nr:hypothetical protein MBAV_001234 [Candidatus Magnetobacterium bavaricum]